MTRAIINDTNVGPDTAPQAFDKAKANFVLCDTDTANIAVNAAAIAAANTNIAANTTNIATVTTGLATANTNIAAAVAVNTTQTANIAANTAAITVNSTNITALQSALSAVSTNVVLLSGSANAATNTAAIQAALTAGGIVNLIQPGVYYINATLLFGSNTVLILGANTTVRLAPSSNCSMLQSSAAAPYLAGGTAVTLTQGALNAVNVAWTGHGLIAGQGVWLGGSSPSAYNGVFRVSAVVDANNFTLYTKTYANATPTGSAFGVVAVQNFALVGGTWDMDYLNQSPPSDYRNHSINLTGLLDCTASDVLSMNATKFCFCLCAVDNFRWWNLNAQGNASDGMKVYGPARSVVGDGLSGHSHDDFISLQTKELPVYIAHQISGGGDIYDCTIKNINADGLGSTFALYPSDNEIMDAVVFDQVTGVKTAAYIGEVNNVTFVNNNIGQVVIRNANIMGGINTRYCTIDQLTFADCSYNPNTTTVAGSAVFFNTGTGAVIDSLIFERIKSDGIPSTAGNINLTLFSGGAFGRIVARDCMIQNGTGTLNLLCFNGTTYTVGEILIDGGYFDASSHYLAYFAGTGAGGSTPNITLRNVLNNGAGAITASGVMTGSVRLEGNTFNGVSLGIVRTSANSTFAIQSDGCNKFTSSAVLVIAAGSPIITAYGPDLKVDAGLLATTKGQSFSHASAVAGRNAANQQGLCIGVDGTHFYALGTGTSGVNTLIL